MERIGVTMHRVLDGLFGSRAFGVCQRCFHRQSLALGVRCEECAGVVRAVRLA